MTNNLNKDLIVAGHGVSQQAIPIPIRESAKDIQYDESIRKFKRRAERRRRKSRLSFYRRILESDIHEYRALKFLLHFPFGLLVGYILFKVSVDRLEFGTEFAIKVALSFILVFAVFFAVSVGFRCVALLLFPYMFGDVGRIYIYTITVTLIISGPLTNLMLNCGEVLRSVGCNFEVFVNLTKSRLGIRLVPLIDAMLDIMANQVELGRKAMEFSKSFLPVHLEVHFNKSDAERIKKEIEENDLDLQQSSRKVAIETKYRKTGQLSRLKRLQKEYEEKLELKCEELLSEGVRGCVLSFRKAEASCWERLSILGFLLCWPTKLSVFCNVFVSVPSWFGISCDAVSVLNEGFSEEFDTAESLTKELEKQFEANMQYEAETGDSENTKQEDIAFFTQGMLWQYRLQKGVVNILFRIVRRLLVLIFIFVIYNAHVYHLNYRNMIDFDNKYITSYFRHIEDRRQAQAKRTLLPLKKLEQRDISYTCSWKWTDEEKLNLFIGLVRALTMVAFVLLIMFFDFLVAEIMNFVKSFARLDFTQQGRHHIALNVTGTGILARIVRSLLHGFNRTHVIDNVLTNQPCLPTSSNPSWWQKFWIFLSIASVVIFAILEAPAMRLRRLICDFFYPKREKTRSLFLYNDMLRRRVGFLHEARHRVRMRCQRNRLNIVMNFFTSLRYQFPRACKWLRLFGLGKKRCLICDEPESETFINCPMFQCKAVYCEQCWDDVNGRCYACRDDDEWTVVSSGGRSDSVPYGTDKE